MLFPEKLPRSRIGLHDRILYHCTKYLLWEKTQTLPQNFLGLIFEKFCLPQFINAMLDLYTAFKAFFYINETIPYVSFLKVSLSEIQVSWKKAYYNFVIAKKGQEIYVTWHVFYSKFIVFYSSIYLV